MLRLRSVLVLTFSSLALFAPQRVLAGSSGTSSVACGSTSVSWSVPKGGVVTHATSGLVASVIVAIGETRTHSMLSHGPGEWVSHSTMFTPGTNGYPTYCDLPVKAGELRSGFPGASQVNQGAIYRFLFDGRDTHYVGYSLAADGPAREAAERAADYAWWSMPYVVASSKQDGGQAFYRLGGAEKTRCDYSHWDTPAQNNCPQEWLGTNDGCDCGCQGQDPDCVADAAFHPEQYSFHNYVDIGGRHLSEPTPDHGSQCASFIAEQHRLANGDYVAPLTYSHAQSVAAGDALYHAVYSECKNGLGDWGAIGAAITCAFPYFDTDICDDAARQVRNCLVDPNQCDSSNGDVWSKFKNNGAAVSRSISPDRLVGASGRELGRAGPWAEAAEAAVQWNAGGNVYGCWF